MVENRGQMLTKTLLRACDKLGISNQQLAEIIRLDEAGIASLRLGDTAIEQGAEAYGLAADVIRIYRALDLVMTGDYVAARVWLTRPNPILKGRPIERMTNPAGLAEVVRYLSKKHL